MMGFGGMGNMEEMMKKMPKGSTSATSTITSTRKEARGDNMNSPPGSLPGRFHARHDTEGLVFESLPSLDSFHKVQDGSGVFFGSLLVSVVAALGEDGQLTLWEMTVESNRLLDVKNRASVRIKYQGRAGNHGKDWAQIKIIDAISPSLFCELVILDFCRFPVPRDHLGLELRLQVGQIYSQA
ncbi:MAG: hypothetical protein MZU95_11295 [Desulfomicrobium escambiense]|nr:hypothetical protein [Desulfomicrobium escambiense]